MNPRTLVVFAVYNPKQRPAKPGDKVVIESLDGQRIVCDVRMVHVKEFAHRTEVRIYAVEDTT